MSRDCELLKQVDQQFDSDSRGITEVRVKSPAPTIPNDVVRPDMESSVASEINKLVANAFPASRLPRVVVFAGIDSPDGNFVCAATASTLSSDRNRAVCVIDANTISPSLASYFSISEDHGLLDAIEGDHSLQSVAHRTPDEALTVVPAGSKSSGQGTLLSDLMRLRISELKEQFDCILFDAPPLHHSAAAMFLGQIADGVVLIVEADSTPRETARRAVQELKDARVSVLGVVLNNRKFPIPENIYSWLR
jgi:Mrp family chromosome partitioning ATPase